MRKVVDQIPESVFVLYGRYDESYRNILELKIEELNLKENVIFKDRVFFEEFPKIFESFDIGVVPYLNNDYMNLALPTKACEYAASGVPMVASYLDTLSKTFNEDCISYVNTEDPEEFAAEIIRLCYDPEFRNHKIHQAYAALKKISWAVMGNNYYHLINELISKRDDR
jgi:glycosyltransferase involved in cell wall biosynthesis